MNRLVGIIGKARSGKSSVARHLRENRDFFPVAFATPSRDMLNVLFMHLGIAPRWDDEDWKEAPLPGIGKSPRQLHQTLGTDWGRNLVHEGLWVDAAARELGLMEYVGYQDLVVEDVRFHNEAQFILDQGGVLIHLIRPDAKPVAAHSSEQADWTGFERHEVINNGSLENLVRLVDNILGMYAVDNTTA
jgi:hypothetical protein